MARINSKICFLVFGLLQLHTVSGQVATSTAATVVETSSAPAAPAPSVAAPAAGKEKTDQSTIVWAVSTDPLDPALSGGGAGGQAEVNTQSSVIAAAASTHSAVAIVTTPPSIRQETTAKVATSAPIISTPVPPGATRSPPTLQQGVAVDPAASPNIRTDVTDTVMALLNETGYSGSANDANVQEVVDMLMNGTVPTDDDLMRLGFITQAAPSQLSTPPPNSIPGNQPPLDTSITLPTGNLPTGTQTGPSNGASAGTSGSSFPNPGFPIGGFPINPLGTPTGSQSPAQPTTGTGGTDPFAGTLSSLGNPAGMPNFLSMLGPPATSPRPTLGDPFSMNTINGGTAAQLPNLGPIDPNALGPKPIPNMGPIGSLGTPGSTTDLLGSLGTMPPGMGLPPGMGGLPPGMGGLPPGMGGFPPGMGGLPPGMGGLPTSPQTGILDAPVNPRNRGGNMMSNPMMMMMMMNPEMMDQMLSGENPMMTYMFMQQMNRRQQRPRPSPTGMGSMGGFPGGLAGAGSLPMSPMGGGPGGLMDMMNTMGAAGPAGMGGAGVPMDLTALTGLGAGMGPTPGAPVNPMDLIQGSLTSSAGPGVPPTDLLPFPGINPGMTGPLPSGAPITDPFVATVG